MAELFESYASDFAQLLRSVEDRLGADLSKLSATTRNTTLQHAESEAEEAHDLLVQMEIEVQSFPQSVRERYAGELRKLKSQYDKLRRELVRDAPNPRNRTPKQGRVRAASRSIITPTTTLSRARHRRSGSGSSRARRCSRTARSASQRRRASHLRRRTLAPTFSRTCAASASKLSTAAIRYVATKLTCAAAWCKYAYRPLVAHPAAHDPTVGIHLILTQGASAEARDDRDHRGTRATHSSHPLFQAVLGPPAVSHGGPGRHDHVARLIPAPCVVDDVRSEQL